MEKLKNKKIIIPVISLIVIGIIAIIMNNSGLLKRITGDSSQTGGESTCKETVLANDVNHTDSDKNTYELIKKLMDEASASYNIPNKGADGCPAGYTCKKPAWDRTEESTINCFTIGAKNVVFNGSQFVSELNQNTIDTLDGAIRYLVGLYNKADFCPREYCESTSKITVVNKYCDYAGNNCQEDNSIAPAKTYAQSDGEKASDGKYRLKKAQATPVAKAGYTTPEIIYPAFGEENNKLTYYHIQELNLNFNKDLTNENIFRAEMAGNNSTVTVYNNKGTDYYAYIDPVAFEDGDDKMLQTNNINANGAYASDALGGFKYYTQFNNTTFNGSKPAQKGIYGTYYVRTCKWDANTNAITDCIGRTLANGEFDSADELRPYIRVRYELAATDATGDTSTQEKWVGTGLTLHAAPSRTNYTFKGWAPMDVNGNQCRAYQGGTDKTGDAGVIYYHPGAQLGPQAWNVSNRSYPCSGAETYWSDGKLTVTLGAIWQRNPYHTWTK